MTFFWFQSISLVLAVNVRITDCPRGLYRSSNYVNTPSWLTEITVDWLADRSVLLTDWLTDWMVLDLINWLGCLKPSLSTEFYNVCPSVWFDCISFTASWSACLYRHASNILMVLTLKFSRAVWSRKKMVCYTG